MKTVRVVCLFLLFAGVLLSAAPAHAFAVPPLPEGNLLQNPWFQDEQGKASLASWSFDSGWTPAVAGYKNPCPDCTDGTAAKWGPDKHQGGAPPGVYGRLWQVVPADPAHTHVTFSTWWVGVRQHTFAVTLEGCETADQAVCVELVTLFSQSTSSDGWVQTPTIEVDLAQGYLFYKLVVTGRYEANTKSLGVKVTGVYLAVGE